MRILLLILLVLVLNSCKNKPGDEIYQGPAPGEIESSILKVNRYILKRNMDHIHGFIRRTGWKMEATGSGLFYIFLEKGKGATAVSGKRISIDYNLKLIDGDIIDSSDQSGPMEFTIGQGGVPSGLEESVLLANQGSVMRIILPPHLAYGNFGDPDLGIPPDAILLYEISINWIK